MEKMTDWFKYDFKGTRILLIEDHPVNIWVETKLLEKVGIEVVSAENGEKGVMEYQTMQPGYFDAVLMDVNMPVMDGLTAARKIRSLDRPDAKTIPIIALTTNYLEEDLTKTIAAGMNEHLVKPVEPQKLMECLYQHIKKSK